MFLFASGLFSFKGFLFSFAQKANTNDTLYLGADLERSPAGQWTKYVHADVKRAQIGCSRSAQ